MKREVVNKSDVWNNLTNSFKAPLRQQRTALWWRASSNMKLYMWEQFLKTSAPKSHKRQGNQMTQWPTCIHQRGEFLSVQNFIVLLYWLLPKLYFFMLMYFYIYIFIYKYLYLHLYVLHLLVCLFSFFKTQDLIRH